MRSFTRFAVGAAALAVAAFSAPAGAFAGGTWNSGGSGGGSFRPADPAPGYQWAGLRPFRAPERVQCDGSEAEFGAGLINAELFRNPGSVVPYDRNTKKDVGGSVSVSYYRQYESYQERIDNPNDTIPGAKHCILDVQVTWRGLAPQMTPKAGLAQMTMEQTLTNAVDVEAAIQVPSFDRSAPYTLYPRSRLVNTTWATCQSIVPVDDRPTCEKPVDIGNCPISDPAPTTVMVAFTSRTCSFLATTTWRFSAEKTGSDGARVDADDGMTTNVQENLTTGWTVQIKELRIGYTDGSQGVASGGGASVPDPVDGWQVAADGTRYISFGTARTPLTILEVDPVSGKVVEFDAPKRTSRDGGTSRPDTGGAIPDRRAEGESGIRLPAIGGFAAALIGLAVAAVGGFLFVGRRHRL